MPENINKCKVCGIIPQVRINNPSDYQTCIKTFKGMTDVGELELVYATCPLDKIILNGKFYTRKLFHQFRCKTCGAYYGMYVDATQGGEIRRNVKAFNPDDYETKKDNG